MSLFLCFSFVKSIQQNFEGSETDVVESYIALSYTKYVQIFVKRLYKEKHNCHIHKTIVRGTEAVKARTHSSSLLWGRQTMQFCTPTGIR